MDRVRLCTSYPAKGGSGSCREEGTGFYSPALPALPWPPAGWRRPLLTILRLSALIWRVWITSFISLQRDTLSKTAAKSNAEPQHWCFPSHAGRSGLTDTWIVLPSWGHIKRAQPHSTHCGPEQGYLYKSKNTKRGLFVEGAWSCISLLTLGLSLQQLVSHSWGCRVPESKSMDWPNSMW